MNQGICKICGQTKPLIDAHIIPMSFFREFGEVPKQYSTKANEYPRLTRRGIYDSNCWCMDCEQLFKDYDDHAALLLKLPQPKFVGDKTLRVQVDYQLMKLFFVSVLWRAHLSGVRFYDKVSVGDFHAARLREMVLNRDAGGVEEYSTWMFQFNIGDERDSALPPHPVRVIRVLCYRFFIVGFTWVTKVDSRPTPEIYRGIIMRPNEPLQVRRMDWQTSQERSLLLGAVQNTTESRNTTA